MFNIDPALLNQPNPNISYATAKKCKPKEGRIYIITGVLWSKQAEKLAAGELELSTLGKVQTLLPKKLELPKGYRMVYHPTHEELLTQIWDENKTYSFEYMDKVAKDQTTIYQELHIDWEWVDWDCDNLKEYQKHNKMIYESWEDYREKFDCIRLEFFPKNESQKAPNSIIPMLEKMLEEAKDREL